MVKNYFQGHNVSQEVIKTKSKYVYIVTVYGRNRQTGSTPNTGNLISIGKLMTG